MSYSIFPVSPRLPKAEEPPAIWARLSPSARKAVKDAEHLRGTRARLADLEREREALEVEAEGAKSSRLARLRGTLRAEAAVKSLKADLPRRRRARETLGAVTQARAAAALAARDMKADARLAKAAELVRTNRRRIARQSVEDAAAVVAVERAERILAKSKALRAARAPARRGARRK